MTKFHEVHTQHVDVVFHASNSRVKEVADHAKFAIRQHSLDAKAHMVRRTRFATGFLYWPGIAKPRRPANSFSGYVRSLSYPRNVQVRMPALLDGWVAIWVGIFRVVDAPRLHRPYESPILQFPVVSHPNLRRLHLVSARLLGQIFSSVNPRPTPIFSRS